MAKRNPPPKPPNGAQAAEDEEKRRTDRNFVETLAGYGMEADAIGLLFVPPKTKAQIETDFALELQLGPTKADLETVSGLRAAVKKGNVTAMIYWTKARMGWTEKGPGEKEKPPESEGSPPTVMPTPASLLNRTLRIVDKS